MTASELRIGNLISDIHASDTFYAEVKQITKARVYYGDFYSHPNDLKPIPLTEEWLKRFGFVRKGYTSNIGKLSLHHKEHMYPNGRVYFNSLVILEKIPEHFHTLQNLYFALAGKELTINQETK